MSWAKIDDRFLMNPKVMSAGLEGRALYLAGILYCAGELTDGKIPAAAVRKLAALSDVEDSDRATQKLLNLNLWEKDAETGGYQIHDYHDYNPTAKEAKEHKQNVSQKRSEAGSKGASARWQNDGKSDGKDMAPREDGKTIAPSPSPSPNPVPNPIPGGEDAHGRDAPAHRERFQKQLPLPPPTEDECRAYFEMKQAPQLAEKFWTRYQSVGWVIQGNPITDWQVRARQWIAEEKDRPPHLRNGGCSPPARLSAADQVAAGTRKIERMMAQMKS